MNNSSDPCATMSKEELLDALGETSERTFDNKRATLERDHGFPTKLPGLKRWSRSAVNRWIDTNGETYMPDPTATDGVGNATVALERRYG